MFGINRQKVWSCAVMLVLIAARLPALTGTINLSQDACEYIDIARNLAAGEGLTLKIRAYFFDDGLGLPFPAMSLRSPWFPLLMGSLYALLSSDLVFQWLNFGLFLANIFLLYLIITPLLPPMLALYALLLAGLAESMFLTSIFPWAEQSAFFWLLLAVLMAGRELHRRWGVAGAALEGLVAALAGLSRPEYLLVGVPFFIWLARSGRRRAAGCTVFLAAYLLPFVAVSAVNAHFYGRTFLPGDYLFRSRHYGAYFSWGGEGRPSAAEFVTSNWLWVFQRTFHNAANYLAKLAGWKNLFALAAALPLVFWKGIRGRYDWRTRHLALVAAVFLFSYCLVWGGIDRERYLLPVTTFLLPLCLLEVDKWRTGARRAWVRSIWLAVMFANLPLYLANTVHAGMAIQSRAGLGERFYASANPAWNNPDLEDLASWVRAHVRDGEALCVVLPEGMAPDRFTRFLDEYGVRYWVNNTLFTKRSPQYLEGLEQAVRAAGAQEVARLGPYRVWRLPLEQNRSRMLRNVGDEFSQMKLR